MTENDYLNELKNGKHLRIKYGVKNHDFFEDDGWWSEELWVYERENLFLCFYPISSYEKNFYTDHSERETVNFIKDAIRDFKNKSDNENVVIDMILEESGSVINSLSIKELVKIKIDNMTDDELRKMFKLY